MISCVYDGNVWPVHHFWHERGGIKVIYKHANEHAEMLAEMASRGEPVFGVIFGKILGNTAEK